MNEISDSEEPNTVFIDEIPIVTHDVCTQTFDSFSNPEMEQHVENSHENDTNQLERSNSRFQLLNDYNNKFKDNDLHEFDDDDDTDSTDTNNDAEEIYEAQYNVFGNDFETQQPPNATELSIILIFVWRKHSMSKAA
ncbi:unnamed protein product, partial [Rotaria sp. Silwood2]